MLLHFPGGGARQVEMPLDIAADALLHLGVLGLVEGVERVVEVEDPGLDMGKIRTYGGAFFFGCRCAAHGATLGEAVPAGKHRKASSTTSLKRR
ncbi:MAG: hypothetical protein WDM81_09795 [Rhizomicrobium sp.]